MLILWFASSAAWSSRRSKARRPKASRPNSASVTNATARVLIVQAYRNTPGTHSAGSASLVMSILDLQFRKLRLNFAIAGARINPESCFRRQRQLYVTIPVLDLQIAQLPNQYFDDPIAVFQPEVTREPVEVDVLGPRRQTSRTARRTGPQIPGIEVQIAIQLGELEISSRRLEHHGIANYRTVDALTQFP